MPKFRTYNQHQSSFIPVNLKKSISSDHIGFVINDIVDDIDISDIEETYSDFGCYGYHPLILIKILFYYSYRIKLSNYTIMLIFCQAPHYSWTSK